MTHGGMHAAPGAPHDADAPRRAWDEQQSREEGRYWGRLHRLLAARAARPFWHDPAPEADGCFPDVHRLFGDRALLQRCMPEWRRLLRWRFTPTLPGPPALLNLGCGAGLVNLAFARRGFCTLGIDLSDEALALARSYAARETRAVRARLEYRRGDLNRPDFGTARFHLVVSMGTLHHVADLDALLGAVAAALHPGGEFLVLDFLGPRGATRRLLEVLDARFGRRAAPSLFDRFGASPYEGVSGWNIVAALHRHFRLREGHLFAAVTPWAIQNVGRRGAPGTPFGPRWLAKLIDGIDRFAVRTGLLAGQNLFAVGVRD